MSEFYRDGDNEFDWVCDGENMLFAEDCAAIMNQQAENIKQLQRQNDELVVRVARLENGLTGVMEGLEDSELFKDSVNAIEKLLNETPDQSLQHIESAILKKHCKEDCYEQLRQQSNGSNGE